MSALAMMGTSRVTWVGPGVRGNKESSIMEREGWDYDIVMTTAS